MITPHAFNLCVLSLVYFQGWKKFFTSTAAPGNGGPLRAPRGQTSILYKCALPRLAVILDVNTYKGKDPNLIGRNTNVVLDLSWTSC